MSILSVRKGLESRLAAMPDVLPTAPENFNYKPVSGQPYQATYLQPLEPENPTFGNGLYRERGFFRIRLMFPAEQGVGPSYAYAEKIRQWFPRGTTINSDGLDIIIRATPSVSAGSIVSDRYMTNVDIDYFLNVCP